MKTYIITAEKDNTLLKRLKWRNVFEPIHEVCSVLQAI
ncbi:hypothetical protein SAMN05518847_110118 [Paenibacillus sp. OV219]|nr:hypothetical protein SAMN05518847_110118 [Paenibacillus sp. OV219]